MGANDIETLILEIRDFYIQNSNPAIVKKYSRFFVEGYDAYGLDQIDLEPKRQLWFNKYRDEFSLDGFLKLGDLLVAGGKFEEVFLAFWFVKKFEKEFNKDTFYRLAAWLENGICNWAETDTFSMDLITPFLLKKIIIMDDLSAWRNSPSKWMRRSVPVSLIKPAQQGLPTDAVLDFIRPLMADTEKVVHQGLGWLLREMWKQHPEEVEVLLMEWKDSCARLIVQYATEKMSAEKRLRFRRTVRKVNSKKSSVQIKTKE